ncbi:NAD(P)/FAD-dependent oxidoreductase [Brucellaceae bacterium C25G]
MVKTGLRVIVVGGGIMGASVAWHLTKLGAHVTVLEKRKQIADGVTRHSYGWIGTSSMLPSDDPAHFSFKRDAISDYSRLERELGTLPIATKGAIVWYEDISETEALITEQRASGVYIEALDRIRIAELEPQLATPPLLAAWAASDFAVEPVILTQQLLSASQEKGAKVACEIEVEGLEVVGSRVVGVRTKQGFFSADVVVLANGADSASLVAPLDTNLPVYTSPAVLMRFSSDRLLANHLLYGQGIEIRPDLNGGLVSAEDYPEDGDAGLQDLAFRTMTSIKEMFASSGNVSLKSVHASYRPMIDGGAPIQQFLSGVDGLYALLAHPGVILAPKLGDLAAKEIIAA